MNIEKLKTKHIVWGHIIFWTVEHFIGFSYYIFSPNPVPTAYYLSRAFNSLLWMTAFYIAYFFIVPITLRKGKLLFKSLKIAFIYIAFIFIDTFYLKYLNIILFGSQVQPFKILLTSAFSFTTSHMIIGVVFRLGVDGLNLAYQKSQLEKQNLKSELALLRSQINPHFLFNTLNNMHSLVYSDPDMTAFSIIKLSEIMRYMLNESSSEKVLLEKEIEYIKSYIALQNMRFSEKEFVKMNIVGDPSGIEISPMIFIPFVENAFKHGDKKKKDVGIDIKLEINDSNLLFEVCNYKRKIASQDIEKNNSFGIVNLKRRLELAYPNRHHLEIEDAKDQYITKLRIDLK